jgi:hypothetical protein
MNLSFHSPHNMDTCLENLKTAAPAPETVFLSFRNRFAGNFEGSDVRLWFRGYRNVFAPVFTGSLSRPGTGSGTVLKGEFKARPLAGMFTALFIGLAVYLSWGDLVQIAQSGLSGVGPQLFTPLFLAVVPGIAWLIGRLIDKRLIRAMIMKALSVSKVEE